MKYYKVLNDNKSCSGGNFDWTSYLPKNGQPGDWTPVIDDVELCERGYHGTYAQHILNFLDGDQLWEVEALEPVWKTDKFACQSMRLVKRIDAYNNKSLRLFAVWCAREALKNIDNPDPRSIAACDVSERYANDEATDEELSAASSAARDAAWAAAWDAAWDAASSAAWAAARVSAWDAARDAARDAAWDAAWEAASSAARDAAWEAAWDAARDAARDAQSQKLLDFLGLGG